VIWTLRKGLRVLKAMAFYRLTGVRHGPLPYIKGRVPHVDATGEVRVGRRFKVDGLQFQVDFGAGPGGRLLVGDDVFFNRGSTIFAAQLIEIGDHTRIADHVTIHDTDFHEVEQGAPVRVAPIRIGRNVWIGRSSIVLPGVTIGDHAVVAAGSVITRDVPARTLVAGAPASVVRELRAADGWVRN
jgi:acetyltransferase-like isoleucine patch superfamily enzyme